MEGKARYTVQASTLGSYFGVGFNEPMEQLLIDLGQKAVEFTEDDERRMRLGRMLEDGILNYFEEEFATPITNRNMEVLTGFEGKVRMKIDGEMLYKGEPTVVEAKISASNTEPFTMSMAYYLQCQAYMEAKGYNQALLLGLYLGKPIYRLIYRNDEVIKDIYSVTTAVFGILNGLMDITDFPYEILDKYSKLDKSELEDFDVDDLGLLMEIDELKKMIDPLVDRRDELIEALKLKYNHVEVDTDEFKFSVKSVTRKGTLDMVLLMQEHPEIDIKKYEKPASVSKTLLMRVKKDKTLG